MAYAKQGKYDQAEPLYRRALETTEKSLGVKHVQYASALRDLAGLYQLQNKPAQAEEFYKRALAVDEVAVGANSAKVASDLEALARLYSSNNEPVKAQPLLDRAREIKKALPGSRFLGRLVETSNNAFNAMSTAARPIADKWALVVGISNFKDQSINLRYAAKDATDFRNFLVSKAHFQPDHVRLLVDSDANHDNIVGQLGDQWLGRRAGPDDLVVVYVSSHGSGQSKEAGGVNFMIAYDTNRDNLLSTGIPMQRLSNIVKERVQSDRVILIMDVCHAGATVPPEKGVTAAEIFGDDNRDAGAGKAVAAPGEKGLSRVAGFDASDLALGSGQTVLCSSLADQVSWESAEYQNSVFTRQLMDALESNGENTTLTQAYKSLRDEVESEVLRDHGELQTPVLSTKQWAGGDPIIAVPPQKPRAAMLSN